MMQLKNLFMAVAAVALMAPLAAHADDAKTPGWYVGAGAMPVFQTDADSNVDSTTDIIKYDTGWGLSGSGGYAFGNGIRAEGEIAYRTADVDEVTGTGSGPVNDGDWRNVSLMGNVLYDFATGTRFTPYVGVGIGMSFVTADEVRTVVNRTLDSTRQTFAYQAIGGVSAALDDNWAVTADYRYFRTLDEKYRTNLDDRATTDNASHNILVGLRYKFVKPAMVPAQAAPAPMPRAPMAAQPAVPPVPQSYMVFFDFDKSVLTPEAKRIIASAAEDFKKGGYIRVVVTGHTDTVGTVKYNQKLSERRAAAVKKEFAQLGVPSAEVQAVGVGKSGLLVPTADGVREAQNRRAEIVFNKQ
ncbi:MAG: OmpA family protein [Alphaproteobacteria bacterium]|nr:OmpA family protein [Alphaproteobacteria bacterium]